MRKTTVVFSAAIAAILTAPLALAGDAPIVDFIVKSASDARFKGCDAVLRQAYSGAEGEDVRVLTNFGDAEKGRYVRITSVHGYEGDTVFMDVHARKVGGECLASVASQIATKKNCAAFLAASPDLQAQAQTLGTTWATFAKNGAPVVLSPYPHGEGCLIHLLRDLSAPAA